MELHDTNCSSYSIQQRAVSLAIAFCVLRRRELCHVNEGFRADDGRVGATAAQRAHQWLGGRLGQWRQSPSPRDILPAFRSNLNKISPKLNEMVRLESVDDSATFVGAWDGR
jgi:hypothetical protein